MTIINQKSISGITSITFASAGDDLLTFHSNNGTERFRIDNSGNTKITAGIVATLTVTGIVTAGGFRNSDGSVVGAASTDNIITGTAATFTSDVNIADSIIHVGDTNTKIRFPAADTFTVETGGSERVRVDSSGNFGVGTNSPNAGLNVGLGGNTIPAAGASTGSALFGNATGGNAYGLVLGATSGGVGYIAAQRADGTGTTYNLIMQPNGGSIGVGTDSPTSQSGKTLHLHNGGGQQRLHLTTNNSGSEAGKGLDIILEHNTDGDAHIINHNTNGDLKLGAGDAERVRITSGGFVGVNDSSPGRAIDVSFDDATTYSETALAPALGAIRIFNDSTTSNSTAGEIVFGSGDSGTAYATIGAKRVGSQETELVFRTSDSATLNEALRINKHGYVQVQANGDGDVRFQFNGNGTRIQNTTSGGHIDFYTNSAVRNRFLYNGQGTAFSNQSRVYPETDNAVDLGSSGNRYDDVYATNGTIQTSDSRLKQEVVTSVLGIDFIKALRPVSYKWIEGKKVPIVDGTDENGDNIYRSDADGNWVYNSRAGARRHWGFIAQEVKQAVDDAGVDFAGWSLADKDDSNSTQSLRYEEFIAPLTKALQEAIAKIETLETQNADLLARVTALEGS